MYSEINLHLQSIFFQHLFDGEQRCMRLRTHFCKSNCSRWRNQDSTRSSRKRYCPDYRGRGNSRGTVLAYALLGAIRHHLACYEVWDVTCAIIEDRERRNRCYLSHCGMWFAMQQLLERDGTAIRQPSPLPTPSSQECGPSAVSFRRA